jgi:hypothetical protein
MTVAQRQPALCNNGSISRNNNKMKIITQDWIMVEDSSKFLQNAK